MILALAVLSQHTCVSDTRLATNSELTFIVTHDAFTESRVILDSDI